MFERIPTLSQRLSRLRATHRATRGDRPAAEANQRRTSLGESMAIGLGCDSYKYRP